MPNIQSEGGDIPVYLTQYKSYVALLTQEGTDAPTAIVVNSNDSNYLGDIVWTRNGVGDYRGTLTGAFTVNKTFLVPGSAGGANVHFFQLNVNEIAINVELFTDGSRIEDFMLENTAFEVRVYQS